MHLYSNAGPTEPDPNVQHVLDLLCQVFRVENVLLALFGDHRIYIRWNLQNHARHLLFPLALHRA